MTTTTRLWTSLFLLSMATACDTPSASDADLGDDDVTERCVSCGGIKFNTNRMGAHEFAELDTTGAWWNNVRLESVTGPELGEVDSVFVDKGALYARKGKIVWPDKYLLNSIWKVSVDEGNGNIYSGSMILKDFGFDNGNRTYTFVHQYSGTGGEKEYVPSCDDDPTEPGTQISAILSGDIVADPDSGVVKKEPNKIYIACLSGGVGKAAKWGYPSYKHELIEFETAIRVVRADYCGNGVSFTTPGMALQLKDKFGVSGFVSPGSKTEAVWDETGAFCVGFPRWDQFPDAEVIQKECEQMGAVAPKICDDDMDLSTVPNSMFWSKLP